MLNIHELERTWLRYKIKSYIPLAIAITLTVVLVLVGVKFWPQLIKETKELTVVKPVREIVVTAPEALNSTVSSTATPAAPASPTPPAAVVESSTVQETATQPASHIGTGTDTEKPTLTLQPSFDFIYEIEEDLAMPAYSKETDKHYSAPAVDTAPSRQTAVRPPVQKAIEPPVQTIAKPVVTEVVEEPIVNARPRSTTQIDITTQEDADDLNDVIKRFKQNKNPALSLFIAKRYYSMGAYQKAYNYALMTNDVDNGIEESWLIFAKSLVKLDQKEMAIKTLKSYLENSESVRAKHLLEEITQGTFQ